MASNAKSLNNKLRRGLFDKDPYSETIKVLFKKEDWAGFAKFIKETPHPFVDLLEDSIKANKPIAFKIVLNRMVELNNFNRILEIVELLILNFYDKQNKNIIDLFEFIKQLQEFPNYKYMLYCVIVISAKHYSTTPKLDTKKKMILKNVVHWILKEKDFVLISLIPHIDAIKYFLKDFDFNIFDPTLWEKYSLVEMARKSEWNVCLFLVSIGRDPSLPDEQGINCFDILKKILSDDQRSGFPFDAQKALALFEICRNAENPKVEDKFSELTRDLTLPKVFFETLTKEDHRQKQLDQYYKSVNSEMLEFMEKHKIKFKEPKLTLNHSVPDAKTEHERSQALNSDNQVITTDKELIKILVSLPTDEILPKLKEIPRYKKFFEAAEKFWDYTMEFQFLKKTELNHPNSKFDIDEFSLDYRDFFSEQIFLKDLKSLLVAINNGKFEFLKGAQSYQTIVQHKKVMWSLSNLSRRNYFERISKRKKQTIQIVEDISLAFIDLTENTPDNQFTFVVHTTSGKADNIKMVVSKELDFIRETPFFSCSLIDRDTTAAEMSHQDKVIFPLSIILDLADDAVIKAFPCDAWSPMLTDYKELDKRLKRANKYLHFIEEQTSSFSTKETFFRASSMTSPSSKSTSLSIVDLENIFKTFEVQNEFEQPTHFSHGKMAHYTPHHLLKATKADFNELIVVGKEKNKILGICVDENKLKLFQEAYLKFSQEQRESAKLSLQHLQKSPYPLILIRSNPKDHNYKKSPRELFKHLHQRYNSALELAKKQALAHSRLTCVKSPSPALLQGYNDSTQKFKDNLKEAESLRMEAETMLREYYQK